MHKKFIKNYYKLLDKKLKNSVIPIIAIAFIIALVWGIFNTSYAGSNKNIEYIIW